MLKNAWKSTPRYFFGAPYLTTQRGGFAFIFLTDFSIYLRSLMTLISAHLDEANAGI
jgi:hypothetical protein